jgi:molybdenum cofactor biosynthesis protein B
VSAAGHRHGDTGRSPAPIAFGLLTISDTREPGSDVSGALLRELVEGAGHRVHAATIVRDEPDDVRATIVGWANDSACGAIVGTGGTGLSTRDRTVDAIGGAFDATLPGFGELFRSLSFAEIGACAILSRASAGVIRGTPVFLLPGSPAAVKLGMTRLVLPAIGHLLAELSR